MLAAKKVQSGEERNMAKIKFCGAAGEVTGSKHLLKTKRGNLLLDCGLFQGKRAEAREKNLSFPFLTEEVSAVAVSHAHIDHTGALPLLTKKGYSGKIFLNEVTAELAEVMLKDSARLQESDSEFFNKIHAGDGEKISPLYMEQDALAAISHFSKISSASFEPFSGLKASFFQAGHVLGSSQLMLETEGLKILYSGDIGRRRQLILKEPFFPAETDYLIIESTYGDREHGEIADASRVLSELIKKAVVRKSKIIIPSFSLERTQEIIFILDSLRHRGMAPSIPVYVDSPMSVEITKIFNRHICECDFNREFMDYARKDGDPFGYEYIHYISEKSQSQKLNDAEGPMIIISASGMCEGGRVLHHLRNSVENENDILLIVGFQAQGTLGRRLRDGEKQVKIFGLKHEVSMEVIPLDFFSAHAGKSDLVSYVKKINPKKGIFLVHGETSQREGLAIALKEEGFSNIFLPVYGEEIELV